MFRQFGSLDDNHSLSGGDRSQDVYSSIECIIASYLCVYYFIYLLFFLAVSFLFKLWNNKSAKEDSLAFTETKDRPCFAVFYIELRLQ